MQLIVLVCSLFIMTASCFAAATVIDSANLLSASDRNTVTKSLNEVEKKYQVRAAFITLRDSKVTDLGKYANTVLDRNYRDGAKGNMLMIVNMANSKFYISTDNKMRAMISDSYGVKQIGNSVAANLKNKKYKDAILSYASQTDKQLAYYAQYRKPMEAPKAAAANTNAAAPGAKKEKQRNTPMAAGGALILGAIAAYMYGSSLKASMSNVANATQANEYMKKGSFKMTEADDTFMYFTYARVKKAKANNEASEPSHFDEADSSSDADHGGGGGDFGDDD